MADDYTDDTQTTGTVTVGGSATGRIETGGDRDWFAVTLVAGKTYRFDLEGSRSRAGTLLDPHLRGIYDAGGSLVGDTTDDDGGSGLNSRVTFTATENATYYVSAGESGNREGTYRLSVSDVTGSFSDDFTGGTGTTGRVTVGGSATGEIDFVGDRDWFAVTLEAGKIYRFDLEGSGASSLYDPYLRGIYDAEGDLIEGTTDNDGGSGRNSRVIFEATAGGTYYVSASENNGYRPVGTYTLSVREISDDFTAGIDTAGTVTVGGSARGEVEFAGDRDWFAVTLEAGKTYWFDLEEGSGARYLYDPYLRGIYDAGGNLIEGTTNDDDGYAQNSRVVFTAPAAATYYVSAGADGNREGTYTLSVRDVTDGVPDDFTAGTGTAGVVTVGGTATGEVETNGDRDWFAVTLEAGKTYLFDLESSGSGALSDPYLRGIFDADGNYVSGTTDDNGGHGRYSRVTFTATDTATYYVSAGAAGNRKGAYTLSVSVREIVVDFTEGADTTGRVTVGGTATGEIETNGDRDWFAVTLEAGKAYQFDLEGSDTHRGTLSDPYLRGIYDAEGSLINGTTNDDGGSYFNSRVTFWAADTATYYVSAASYEDFQGTYTLSVRDVTGSVSDDFTEGNDTTGRVTVGGTATGEIEFDGDRDWFAVTLAVGKTYQFDLEGSGTRDVALWVPFLRGIYDAGGALIDGTTNDDNGSGRNSRVTFTANATATYYVSASGWEYGGAPSGRDFRGTYTLSVSDITNSLSNDLTAGIDTTGRATVGGTATGELEIAGDHDWFAVTLEMGKSYRFDLEGLRTHRGTLIDPYLYGIYDADGDPIEGTTDDDGGIGWNGRVTFTATATGTYYVSAGAWRSPDGPRQDDLGTYTLSVSDVTNGVPDDFTEGIGTTGRVTVGSSATGNIDFGGDSDWFAVTLEAGKSYRFEQEGWQTHRGTLIDPYLRGIYDADGNYISGTTNDDGGTSRNSRVVFTATATGTYYVSASAWGAYGNLEEGTYALSVRDVTDIIENDFTEGIGTTGRVTVGGSVTGRIDFEGDRDWFAVTLDARTAYRFDLESRQTGAGTLYDPYLYGIYDADGNYISGTTNDDGGYGINSRVRFWAPAAATYYVSAGSYGDGDGSYTLSVEEVM